MGQELSRFGKKINIMNKEIKNRASQILSKVISYIKENKKEIALFFAVAISLWFIIGLIQNLDGFSEGFTRGFNE